MPYRTSGDLTRGSKTPVRFPRWESIKLFFVHKFSGLSKNPHYVFHERTYDHWRIETCLWCGFCVARRLHRVHVHRVDFDPMACEPTCVDCDYADKERVAAIAELRELQVFNFIHQVIQ